MSVSLSVLLALDSQPDTNQLNELAKELKYEIVFEESISLTQHSGFLPTRVNSEEAGFELYVYQAKKLGADALEILPEERRDNRVYELRIGGNPLEFHAAGLTEPILSSSFNGVVLSHDCSCIPSRSHFIGICPMKAGLK